MPPESERDAHLEGLTACSPVGYAPAAPRELRERVRGLRAPEPRRTFGWKPVLVIAPLVVALLGAALLGGRGSGEREESAAVGGRESLEFQPGPPAAADQALRTSPVPATTRAQEWDVALELALRDNGRLSEASAKAIRATRELGGFVVSSNVATQGRSGNARLLVRVPQRRVQEAIALFSGLGTITGQQVSIQDRQGEALHRLARRIDTLRVQVAQLNVRLRNEELSEAEPAAPFALRRQRAQAEGNSADAAAHERRERGCDGRGLAHAPDAPRSERAGGDRFDHGRSARSRVRAGGGRSEFVDRAVPSRGLPDEDSVEFSLVAALRRGRPRGWWQGLQRRHVLAWFGGSRWSDEIPTFTGTTALCPHALRRDWVHAPPGRRLESNVKALIGGVDAPTPSGADTGAPV